MSQLIPILLLIGFLVFVVFFIRLLLKLMRIQARNTKALREHGVTTTATIVGRYTSWGSGTQRIFWLKVQYTVNDTRYNASMRVAKTSYESFPDGTEFKIVYLPENPKTFMGT